MRFKVFKNTALLFVFVVIACASKSNNKVIENDSEIALSNAIDTIIVGANRTEVYMPFDAADVLRFGKDLVVQHGFTTNLKGIDWLKRHYKDHRVHAPITK